MPRAPDTFGVHSLAELVVPTELMLDTDFVFKALRSDQTDHAICSDYLSRAAESGTTFFFSTMLELELVQVAWRGTMMRVWKHDWRARCYDGRHRRTANAVLDQVVKSWERFLRSNDYARVEVDAASFAVADHTRSYGLQSYDSLHLATAALMGVKDFATCDKDFSRVPASLLTLHVPPHRVAECRATRRSKAGYERTRRYRGRHG